MAEGLRRLLQMVLEAGIDFVNAGLLLGILFGALIVLRPAANRLLSPGQRVLLWGPGWVLAFFVPWVELAGRIYVLPVTVRGWAVQAAGEQYIPDFSAGPGRYTMTLPDGGAYSFSVTQDMIAALGAVFLLSWLGILLLGIWSERRLRRLGLEGQRMDGEALAACGVDEAWLAEQGLDGGKLAVRVCSGLPTSFVRSGHDTGRRDGVRWVVCLQAELPRERMELVLRHELEHICQHHTWLKTYMWCALAFHWWNPIFWIAYRLTCRDMELACDRAVLARLDGKGRREYARTLVELGSGRYLWSVPMSFGECDAALRVRQAVNWRPRRRWCAGLSVLLTAFLLLFLYTMPRASRSDREAAWNQYISSGELRREVERRIPVMYRDDMVELWTKGPGELIARGSSGRWYICHLRWSEEEGYQFGSVGLFYPEEGQLGAYSRVS